MTFRKLGWVIGAVALNGCDKAPAPAGPETGVQLYDYHCADCHRGGGEGIFLKGVPQIRYTQLTQAELVGLIMDHNRPDESRMPHFEITEGQAEAIALHILDNLGSD